MNIMVERTREPPPGPYPCPLSSPYGLAGVKFGKGPKCGHTSYIIPTVSGVPNDQRIKEIRMGDLTPVVLIGVGAHRAYTHHLAQHPSDIDVRRKSRHPHMEVGVLYCGTRCHERSRHEYPTY